MPKIPAAKCTLLDIFSQKGSLNSQSKTMVHGTKLEKDAKGLIPSHDFALNQQYQLIRIKPEEIFLSH